MNEVEWVKSIVDRLQTGIRASEPALVIKEQKNLPYANEIRSYTGSTPNPFPPTTYETDLLVYEELKDGTWTPRLVIEAKINSVTTHDAITYSQKAATHKNVHPYLRYGILIGNRQHYPLPGRLFRHGAYFDFMLSWCGFEPSATELADLLNLILAEVTASRKLEEMLFSSRKSDREHYTYLHRPLILK